MNHSKVIKISFVALLLGASQLPANENSHFSNSAKIRSFVPDSVVEEAYKKGHDVGYVTGGISKNIVYTTYKTSHDAGYTSGKAAKRFWRKLWR